MMRAEIIRLLRASPFRPFAIITDSGHHIVIRHPENVAYDPVTETADCYALADGIMHILPWEKITSVGVGDRGQPLPASPGQGR
jgi:hypothetical protein